MIALMMKMKDYDNNSEDQCYMSSASVLKRSDSFVNL